MKWGGGEKVEVVKMLSRFSEVGTERGIHGLWIERVQGLLSREVKRMLRRAKAGLLDIEYARRLALSDSAVDLLLDGAQPAAYNPVELWPMAARVVIFHGRDDEDVPVKIARLAAQRAAALGQDYRFALFAGDHYTWIDPQSSQWAACVGALTPLHY